MAMAPVTRASAGRSTISRLGASTGFFEIRRAAPKAAEKRNRIVPNASPAAIDVCPRPAATNAAPRDSRSTPNSNAPSTNGEMRRAWANLPAPRMAASAPTVSTAAPPRRRTMASATLVVADAGEVEARDLECGDARSREEEFAHQGRVATDHLHVPQRFQNGLGESEVLHRVCDFAVLDQPRPIPGHAGDGGLDGVDHVRVVELGDEQSMLRRSDHVLERCVTGSQEEVQGKGAVGAWRWERVAGRLGPGHLGAPAVVHAPAEHALVDQVESPLGSSLEVEGEPKCER